MSDLLKEFVREGVCLSCGGAVMNDGTHLDDTRHAEYTASRTELEELRNRLGNLEQPNRYRWTVYDLNGDIAARREYKTKGALTQYRREDWPGRWVSHIGGGFVLYEKWNEKTLEWEDYTP